MSLQRGHTQTRGWIIKSKVMLRPRSILTRGVLVKSLLIIFSFKNMLTVGYDALQKAKDDIVNRMTMFDYENQ